MIPVTPQAEPASFDAQVRKPGLAWLSQHSLPLVGGKPTGVELEPYWRRCLDDLHVAYGGICAYVSVYIEPVTGARTVEHFVPKSQELAGAYEWGNYRLACARINSRKGDVTSVLDPFELVDETFRLELVSGRIYVNPALASEERAEAQKTIDILGLDAPDCRELRAKYFNYYCTRDISLDYLRRRCPFL